MLRIDDENDPTSIRIIDLSGDFAECGSFVERKSSSPLAYFTMLNMPLDLNTNSYRDIILFSNKSHTGEIIELTFICSIYKSESKVKPVNKIIITLDYKGEVIDTKVSNYVSNAPH